MRGAGADLVVWFDVELDLFASEGTDSAWMLVEGIEILR